jgi:ATP-binding cassette subfamily B protein
MAESAVHKTFLKNPIRSITEVIRLERNEITSIYFYAVLNGLIQLSLPIGIQSIISFILGGRLTASLVLLICIVVLGVLLTGFTHVNQMRLIEKIQQKIFVRYAFDYSERIALIDSRKTTDKHIPELLNRFFDIASLQKSISKLLLDIPAASIQIIFGLLLLSFYHYFFIFFGMILVLIIYLVLKYTGIKGMLYSIEESNYKFKLGGWLQEMARNLQTVQFSKRPESFHAKTDEYAEGYLKQRTMHFTVLLKQFWTLIIFKVVVTASMLIVGSYLLLNQQLNIGQFIAAEIVILMVINSVEKLIINLDNAYDVLTSVDKLNKIKELPLEKSTTGSVLAIDQPMYIELVDVSLPDKRKAGGFALQHINLSINPGSRVCFMGKIASGKQELLQFLAGYYSDYQGIFAIQNVPFPDIHIQEYRKHLGVYFQLNDIFEGTIHDNLTMGDKSISMEEIARMSASLGLDSYVKQLPDGYSTLLSGKGKVLNKGIRMKIMICRALLKQPKLILIEEPFEALDIEDRFQLEKSLLAVSGNVTIVVATNNKKFASNCDEIVVMEHGTIKTKGSWNQVQIHCEQL